MLLYFKRDFFLFLGQISIERKCIRMQGNLSMVKSTFVIILLRSHRKENNDFQCSVKKLSKRKKKRKRRNEIYRIRANNEGNPIVLHE